MLKSKGNVCGAEASCRTRRSRARVGEGVNCWVELCFLKGKRGILRSRSGVGLIGKQTKGNHPLGPAAGARAAALLGWRGVRMGRGLSRRLESTFLGARP